MQVRNRTFLAPSIPNVTTTVTLGPSQQTALMFTRRCSNGRPSRTDPELQDALDRYRSGELRTIVFRDLVLGSIRQFPAETAVVLDIGCGHGFHGELELQRSLAVAGGRFIGVEPDQEITPPPFFTELHRCTFEQAPLAPDSVQVAYAVFVLEHIHDPAAFWKRLYACLAPGGVFWGFTVDRRHWFSVISQLAEALRLKGLYMTRLRGRRTQDRYEDYPVFYRANSPRAIGSQVKSFQRAAFASMHRVGQTDFYVPRPLRWFSHALERLCMAAGLPGSILIVKLTK
jgi:SAM-dependent methyltransferase